MSYWAGLGFGPKSSRMLASEADREATQAVLKQAFEERRLLLDEFESRIGRALVARTQGELARLIRDIPTGPAGPAIGGRAPGGLRLNRRGKEVSHRFRLLPSELCQSCGSEIESYRDGLCLECNSRSLPRTTGIPELVRGILVNLPLLERESAIEKFLTRAPREHSAILALTGAIADAGVRIRDAHPNEDVRKSGTQYLSADDIWMLDLALDVMYLLAGQLPGKSSPWDDDHDRIPQRLGWLDEPTRARHWKRAVRQAGAGPAQFQQLRAQVARRAAARR
jgi:hypothetical protein